MKLPIWPSDYIIDGKNIWFMHGKINLLMKYDMEAELTYCMGTVPGEEMFKENLYQNIYKHGNVLILIPSWAREIAIYHISEERFEKVNLYKVENYVGNLLFRKVFAFDKYLYCIPYSYKAMVKIDMESLTLEYDNPWVEPIIKRIGGQELCINDATQINDSEVMLVCNGTNLLIYYNMVSEKIKFISIGEKTSEITSVSACDGNVFLYNTQDGTIIVYSTIRQKIINKFLIMNEATLHSTGTNMVLVDSINNENVLFVDDNGNKIQIDDPSIGVARLENSFNYSYHHGICKKDRLQVNSFFFFNRENNIMYYFVGNSVARKFNFRIIDKELEKIKEIISSSFCDIQVDENQMFNLNMWINTILEKSQRKNDSVQDYSIGSMIFSQIKDNIK